MDKGAEYGLLRYLLCAVGYVQKQNERIIKKLEELGGKENDKKRMEG